MFINQKGFPFTFEKKSEISSCFPKNNNLRIFSLRYSADFKFRRSRVVFHFIGFYLIILTYRYCLVFSFDLQSKEANCNKFPPTTQFVPDGCFGTKKLEKSSSCFPVVFYLLLHLHMVGSLCCRGPVSNLHLSNQLQHDQQRSISKKLLKQTKRCWNMKTVFGFWIGKVSFARFFVERTINYIRW